MRSLPLVLLAAFSPLAAAADRPPQDAELPIVKVGIEQSRAFALPAGAKAAGVVKPKIAHVEEDETRIPVHLHIAADGSTRVECREGHSATSAPARGEETER